MSEQETTATVDDETQDSAHELDSGEGALGDAGKQALDRMKAERAAAKAEARDAKTELERVRAELALRDKPAEEQALEAAKAEARAEATSAANLRVVKANLRAAATGKLADPTDILAYPSIVDPGSFEVDDDGNVDSDTLADAVNELLAKKPHLAAQQGRFQGGGDGGAKAPAKPAADDIDDAIKAATAARNFALAATLKTQKAAQKG
jgi:hypothetical protein